MKQQRAYKRIQNCRFMVLAAVVCVLCILSCETTEETSQDAGYFVFDQKKYALSDAFYITEQAVDDLYVFHFSLYSGFNYNPASSTIGQITGIGSLIEFSLCSRNDNDVEPGSYEFKILREEFDIAAAVLKRSWNIGTASGSIDTLSQGSILIDKENDVLNISFNLTSESQMTVEGSYSGVARRYILRPDQKTAN